MIVGSSSGFVGQIDFAVLVQLRKSFSNFHTHHFHGVPHLAIPAVAGPDVVVDDGQLVTEGSPKRLIDEALHLEKLVDLGTQSGVQVQGPTGSFC